VERIPILRMGEFLLVTIQVDMHDRLALALQDDLTNRVSETGARGVLIDISSLEIADSFIGRMIANISRTARVLDAPSFAPRATPEGGRLLGSGSPQGRIGTVNHFMPCGTAGVGVR